MWLLLLGLLTEKVVYTCTFLFQGDIFVVVVLFMEACFILTKTRHCYLLYYFFPLHIATSCNWTHVHLIIVEHSYVYVQSLTEIFTPSIPECF